MTVAEYYRDMGFSVALITDSLSRYAEAMNETSKKPISELAGEYPADLESNILGLCERAGKVICLGSDKREGSITMISSVSLSNGKKTADPVLETVLRGAGLLIKLDAPSSRSAVRPSIDQSFSYSLYRDRIAIKYRDGLAKDWPEKTDRAQKLLKKGCELDEKARLLGIGSLSEDDRITLETARLIKTAFIGQSSLEERSGCPETDKQIALLRLILLFDERARGAVKEGASAQRLCELSVLDKIREAKSVGYESHKTTYAELSSDIRKEIASASAEQ
jgi:V/A-type H+-transporting ATPase subunit A